MEDDNEVEEEEHEEEDEAGDKGFRSLMHGNDDDDATDIFLGLSLYSTFLSVVSVSKFLMCMVEERGERGVWVLTLSDSVFV